MPGAPIRIGVERLQRDQRAREALSEGELERALWRDFHRARSVADLARALAARIGGGATADEVIATAESASLFGPAARERGSVKNEALRKPPR